VARGVVQAMLGTLGADDRFIVLACDTACERSPDGLRTADDDSAQRVERFLEGQELGGASDLGGMLEAASEALQATTRRGVDHVIVYLGDGVPTSGELAPDRLGRMLTASLGDTTVQAVALGARADLLTLDMVTRQSGGDVIQADARDDFAHLVRELRARAEIPPVRAVELDVPEGMVAVHPRKIAGFRPGESVTLIGKLSHPVSGPVRLRARMPDGSPFEDSFDVDLAAERGDVRGRHAHLPRTWARHQIDHLTVTAGHDARADIIAMSKAYGVLSRYTALLVLENDAMYREFNVVRAADRTDKWDGRLGSAGADARKAQEEERARRPAGMPGDDTAEPALGSQPSKDQPATQEKGEAPAPASGETRPATDAPADDLFDDDSEEKPATAQPAADEEPSFDFDEEEDDTGASAPAGSGTARIGGQSGRGRGTAGGGAPKRRSKKSRPEPKSSPRAEELHDPLGGLAGGGNPAAGAGGGGGPWTYRPRPVRKRLPSIQIARARHPTRRTLDMLARMKSERDRDPTKRSSHQNLVRGAIRAGHAETLDFAAAWAEADPDHTPALLALADALAAKGDGRAIRAYGSAVELRPFSDDLHERLAKALESKGDLVRACSHRRAVVSIDPAPGEHHVALVRCLVRARDDVRAREAAREGAARAKRGRHGIRKLAAELDRGALPAVPEVALHGHPDVRVTLEWMGPADLDIAVIDRRGRRLSALRPERVRVREAPGRETLTLRSLEKSVYVEVTAPDLGGPFQAELEIKTPYSRRTFPVNIEGGSVRVAHVRWRR
jgi:hypothetical protein